MFSATTIGAAFVADAPCRGAWPRDARLRPAPRRQPAHGARRAARRATHVLARPGAAPPCHRAPPARCAPGPARRAAERKRLNLRAHLRRVGALPAARATPPAAPVVACRAAVAARCPPPAHRHALAARQAPLPPPPTSDPRRAAPRGPTDSGGAWDYDRDGEADDGEWRRQRRGVSQRAGGP